MPNNDSKRGKGNKARKQARYVADVDGTLVPCEVTWTGGELPLPKGNDGARAYVCNAIADGVPIVGAALIVGALSVDRQTVKQSFGAIVESAN